MIHTTFDTLAFANRLKNAGADSRLAEEHSEAMAEILGGLMENQLATKKDLVQLEIKLSALYLRMTVGSVTLIIALQTLLHFV
jgi:hypothetical protein